MHHDNFLVNKIHEEERAKDIDYSKKESSYVMVENDDFDKLEELGMPSMRNQETTRND